MTSIPPSSKRKRANEEESDAEPTITKSKYWFDDGNVIIQVENTQFRVHRSMLSRHSSVFSNMFDIPQPPETEKGTELDGCPLIHLSDKAGDFEHVMSIFYDNIRDHDMRVAMSFDHCAAILRLGKKYDIEHLFNEGLRRFRYEHPSDFSDWDELYEHGSPGQEIDILSDPIFCERALALAHELSINRALPAICLTLIQTRNTSGILDFLEEVSKTDDNLYAASHLFRQCLKGRDQILCRIHRLLRDWACSADSSPIPDKKCSKSESCTSYRALAVMKISEENSFSGIEIMDNNALPSEIDDLICSRCKASLQTAVKQARLDLWRDLPSLFKLGNSWEDLKDF